MHARSTRRIKVRIRVQTGVVAATAALIAGLLPAPAGAANPTHSLRVAQSKDSVLGYWTDARLQNAESADIDLDQSAASDIDLGAPSGPSAGSPAEFEGTSAPSMSAGAQRALPQAPIPTEGKVFFTGSDGYDYMCSGTAVSSENESMVWTAGHCVNGGRGQGYHSNWVFIPGYDNGETPYGVWAAEWLGTPTPWARFASLKYDVGAAIVGTNDGMTLGDTVGMEGIAFNQPAAQYWTALGYPAGWPFDGEELYACDSPTLGRDDPGRIRGRRTIYIDCNMNGGSSGGGWFFTAEDGYRYLGSVNSYGIRGHRNWMFGPYQGRAALTLYGSMSSI